MEYNESEILKELKNEQTCRQAFSKIVEHYSQPLYWKIRHIVVEHEDTNDILQNTFIKAWNKIDNFQNKASLYTWLYRIAINESLDFIRSQKNNNNISTDQNDGLASRLLADEYFDGDKIQARLQEAISRLPDVQRSVFCLRYYDEMKYSKMSEILGTSEGALKASYHLAVKKIVDFLKLYD
ncbi:RNA polymerase sigma factor [Segatella paludivivens]|uniref:RNA polymerase sigma factor n=1 Tax=Segatella paludivivens TaxID=185294 RepID=UPI00035F7A84|nr:sigma-70 family RNA polymerase sigma factor [Segatella paludivivens]